MGRKSHSPTLSSIKKRNFHFFDIASPARIRTGDLLVTSPMLYQLSHLELLENLTIFGQNESAVDHWKLRNFCVLVSTASKMASTYTKSLLSSPKRPGLQSLLSVLSLFLFFIDFKSIFGILMAFEVKAMASSGLKQQSH